MDKVTIQGRHQLILDDPCNLRLDRVDNAGTLVENETMSPYIIMHNGVKVYAWPYGYDFGQIFIKNKGVHEPQEEVVFKEVLKTIPKNGVMIEVGAWWSFYSLWFNKEVVNASNYMIEPIPDFLEEGKRNFSLNNAIGDFTLSFIETLPLDEFIKTKDLQYIDILHADIQGSELIMLDGMTTILKNRLVNYIFISTHSQNLHIECKNRLISAGMTIIADADYDNDTYCCDGVLVATFNSDFPVMDIGSYSKNQSV